MASFWRAHEVWCAAAGKGELWRIWPEVLWIFTINKSREKAETNNALFVLLYVSVLFLKMGHSVLVADCFQLQITE